MGWPPGAPWRGAAFVLLRPYSGQTAAQVCVREKVFWSLERAPNSAREIRAGFPEEVTFELAL